jgi:hypothetical protein
MCLPNGTRLATCTGPAHGANQSSLRAEGYSMLSLAWYHLFLFCDVHPKWKTCMSCDNKGLIHHLMLPKWYTCSRLGPDEQHCHHSPKLSTNNILRTCTWPPGWQNQSNHNPNSLTSLVVWLAHVTKNIPRSPVKFSQISLSIPSSYGLYHGSRSGVSIVVTAGYK